mgnify:CR=1 FL=1
MKVEIRTSRLSDFLAGAGRFVHLLVGSVLLVALVKVLFDELTALGLLGRLENGGSDETVSVGPAGDGSKTPG